jgi:hypothetical protein
MPICLFGGLASVIRFDDLNSDDGLLGLYNPSPAVVSGIAQTLYQWPTLPAGNTVEQAKAKLHVRDGLWRYHNSQSNSATVGSTRSSITAGAGVIFGTNGSGSSTVVDGGVKVGDYVRLTANMTPSGRETLITKVIGLRGAPIAATNSGATLASTAYPTQSASSSVVTSPPNSMTMTVTHTNYNGLDSNVNETYTITVLTSGAAGTATIQVRSASGNDDVDSVQTAVANSPVTITPRGLQVTFAVNGAYTTLVAGQVYVVSVADLVANRTLAISGTYTGTKNRAYIVEVVKGGFLASNTVKVRVRSQDGTDQLAPVTLTEGSSGVSVSFAIGSYGLTGVITAASGLVRGDSWLLTATAATTGALTIVDLSDQFSSAVATDNTSVAMTYEFFRPQTVEIPRTFNSTVLFSTEATQLSVRAAIAMTFDDITYGDVPISCGLYGFSALPSHSVLYTSYRSWYPAFQAPVQISASADLSLALSGPNDVDNPLKKAVSVGRLTATADAIYVMAVGDPSVLDNWDAAHAAADLNPVLYQYVPLSSDPGVLSLAAGAIVGNNAVDADSNRVGWFAAAYTTGEIIASDSQSTNSSHLLAVVEDNPNASGTQYTQVRITSGNGNLQTLGVRVGDQLRYDFDVDVYGNVTYSTRTITQIVSGTTVIIDSELPQNGIAKRVEVYRVFKAADAVDYYSQKASAWASPEIRFVLAPEVLVGGEWLPGYYAAVLGAGLRSSLLPQQPLSTIAINGLEAVRGLELFKASDLNLLAGAGCMIFAYDYNQAAVTVRHGVTTGETEILAKREESMVTARHIAMRSVRSVLRPLVAQLLLSPVENDSRVEELVRSTLDSLRGELKTAYYTPMLGGLIADLVITSVTMSKYQQDELVVAGNFAFGRPDNLLTFETSVS